MTAAPIYGVFLSSRLSPVSLEGVIAFRGLTGRALPSVVAAGWFLCLAVWAIQVFPHAGASFAGLAPLGCVIFFVLVFVTNSLARPKFLIPVIMHNTPATLESHLAARARRMGRPTRGRPIDVPDLVTVIVDRKRDAGWHGWSTDLPDLELDASTLEKLDRSAQADLNQRFANPGHHSKLSLQFLVEEKSAGSDSLPPMSGVPKEQLFEAKPRPGGGYTAQSVEQPGLEVYGDLDELLSSAAATGSKTVRLTWSYELAF